MRSSNEEVMWGARNQFEKEKLDPKYWPMAEAAFQVWFLGGDPELKAYYKDQVEQANPVQAELSALPGERGEEGRNFIDDIVYWRLMQFFYENPEAMRELNLREARQLGISD